MRARQVLVLCTAVLCALPVAVSPAQAAGETINRSGLPADWSAAWVTCDTGEAATGALSHVSGPGAPPLGSGSLAVRTPATVRLALFRSDLPVPAADLQDLSFGTYVTSGDSDGSALLQVDEDGDATTYERLLVLVRTTPSGWETLRLSTNQLVVITPGQPRSTATWDSYRLDHPTAVVTAMEISSGCGSAEATTHLDALRWTAASGSSAYDFEPLLAALPTSLSASTIAPGQSVTVRGTLESSGTGVAGQRVELWRRPPGASAFSKVGTVTSGGGGALSAVQTPTGRTSYQWRLPSGSPYVAPLSSVTIAVRPTLTLHVYDRTLTRTQPVFAWGSTQRQLAGTTVSLLRSGSSRPLTTARVQSDGTYAFSRALGLTGTYHLRVTSPASASKGISAAASATVSISVR